ncbi:glycosyltransferase [Marinomonas primoryensis]|uniref:Glycosyltransferase n=1 Tax=Marinomonas primoryensis TaxID=178399 RepID=A0A859CZ32_9GAMM|nr:glycosyltransferase [Marinomonas primoryensis]QKK81945.1 glycosyltransferase [Marinomonas primoryensis]
MRTLVIVRTLKTGGMERVAVNLADAFADQGHESHLLYYKKRKDPLYPDNKGVLVHEFNVNKLSLKRPLSILSEIAAKISNLFWRKSYFLIAGWYGGQRLQKKMNQLEKQYGTFDRIIFRGEGTYENIWSFQHDKAIYVLENIVKPNSPSQKLSKKRFHALFHNRQLAAVSTGVKIAADDLFAKENIHPTYVHVITNPCPIEQIRSKANAEKPQTLPSGPYMLNVARLVPQKGQDMLLEAYAKSKQSLPLVIVGEGKLNAELKAKAKALGIDENVHFVGNQENPYVWMKHAELFVLSSKFEGLGIVLFEALACGTPILSVDCPGGVRDVFKGELEPYLCEHNADALAEKMDLVIEQGGYVIKEEWIEDFKPENVVNAFLQK